MVTFDQAFANTKQDTRLSIKTKLQARGYDLEGELDDSFMGLQEKDSEAAGLTPPETTALRHVLAKIIAAAAAVAAAAVPVTAAAQAEVAAKALEGGRAQDQSAQLVQAMLEGLGSLSSLPKDAQEFAALLQGMTGMKIPVADSAMNILQANLNDGLMQLLQPVLGYHVGVSFFTRFLLEQPYDAGKEGTATLAMQVLFHEVMRTLGRYSMQGSVPKVRYNLTERGAGSTSGAVGARLRPDLTVVVKACTALLGEDKEDGCLRLGISDMENYVTGGLPASQYGSVPGLPAYAASGLDLQFLFITREGQVHEAGDVIDLGTYVGRQLALRAAIHCYRLVVAIQKLVPPLVERMPLWMKEVRHDTEVTLRPTGAFKTIPRFKAFAQKHGVTQETIKAAYEVAAVAAQQQCSQGQLPYLVTAQSKHFTRHGFEVSTTPLGYKRKIVTVMDAQRVAISCLHAARALHEKGLVYTDFRKDNIVWLSEEHCMVIDLETCRLADQPLPQPVHMLRDWDEGTLEKREDNSYFTPASDLYQIGKMLRPLQPVQQSQLGGAFVQLLMSKTATTAEALQHIWLQPGAATGDGG